MALPIGWWIWAGSPVAASETNDAGLGNRKLQNMASLMSSYDLMITDKAFRSLREKLNILCGWTKAKNKSLADWQKQENKEISTERGILEYLLITKKVL